MILYLLDWETTNLKIIGMLKNFLSKRYTRKPTDRSKLVRSPVSTVSSRVDIGNLDVLIKDIRFGQEPKDNSRISRSPVVEVRTC